EKASEELDKIGLPALEALRKAIKNGDAEVGRRAEELVSRIEKRAETAAILAPTKVRLTCKDTPVTQAVADLAKKSGYAITLQDPEKKLKDRRVPLDTGEVSFGEAFAQLCDRAGLVEGPPAANPPRPTPGGPTTLPVRPVIRPAIEVKPLPADKPVEKPKPAE